ncbi:MAG: hypothetical protein ACOYJK_05830 [Prevotella sp.]|jgi:hypothetical protein
MKKFVLGLCLMFAITSNAQGIGNVRFGTAYDEAMACIKAILGTPIAADASVVTYKDVSFKGFKWSEITFTFKNGRLAEARCYMNQRSKRAASSKVTDIAKVMAKDHVMSMDFEDDGNKFYAGGKSPEGFGHLFTIFISPRNGVWTTQMRFGPFRI